MAEQVAKDIFTEVVVAPATTDGALEVLTPARRTSASWSCRTTSPLRCTRPAIALRPISGGGGCSLQPWTGRPWSLDAPGDDPATTWTLAAGEAVDEATLADLPSPGAPARR
jgi:phosphoribosylaminoimidazolecarboxamide formyltransferase/IMP cyclohydrolase